MRSSSILFLFLLLALDLAKFSFTTVPIDLNNSQQQEVDCIEEATRRFREWHKNVNQQEQQQAEEEDLLVRHKRFVTPLVQRISGTQTKNTINKQLYDHRRRVSAMIDEKLQDHKDAIKKAITNNAKSTTTTTVATGRVLNGQAVQRELLKIERKLDRNWRLLRQYNRAGIGGRQQQQQFGVGDSLHDGQWTTGLEHKMAEMMDAKLTEWTHTIGDQIEQRMMHVMQNGGSIGNGNGHWGNWGNNQQQQQRTTGFGRNTYGTGNGNWHGGTAAPGDLDGKVDEIGTKLEHILEERMNEMMRRDANRALQSNRQMEAIKTDMDHRLDELLSHVQSLRTELGSGGIGTTGGTAAGYSQRQRQNWRSGTQNPTNYGRRNYNNNSNYNNNYNRNNGSRNYNNNGGRTRDYNNGDNWGNV